MNGEEKDAEKCPCQAMDQWIAVLLRGWRNGILPSMWKAESIQELESSSAALTQSVELIWDVQERFATIPNGPVADRVTSKFKAVLDKNPGFYVLKQVSNVLSGADSKIPGELRASKVPDYKYAPLTSVDVERSFCAYKH
ncbi:hypothetical protein HPB50_007117 [Hyalomma asiaticum]|uniref:Uncharacterized protein n=1 Tax=Hyalomma asiaticum TaxID=266040 RepID=A0ACB7RQ41_HYAAI|nr:hypothetical protein HPB50_007117 [Hyalomma asiaticum]